MFKLQLRYANDRKCKIFALHICTGQKYVRRHGSLSTGCRPTHMRSMVSALISGVCQKYFLSISEMKRLISFK